MCASPESENGQSINASPEGVLSESGEGTQKEGGGVRKSVCFRSSSPLGYVGRSVPLIPAPSLVLALSCPQRYNLKWGVVEFLGGLAALFKGDDMLSARCRHTGSSKL